MSAVALLFIVSSAAAAADFSGFDCDSPYLRHSRKVEVAACIADCLDLDFEATEKNCSYNLNTGKLILKYENFQEDGCPKCILDRKNVRVNSEESVFYICSQFKAYKSALGFVSLISYSMCGKKLVFANVAIPTDFDTTGMICGIIWPMSKHWLPKDWDDVRCVIESLPEEIQRVGKLRLVAYRSNCSKEFFFCSTDTPRSLRKSFLFEELNNLTPLATNNGTCAIFDYKIKNKKAVDVKLRAADCKEKSFAVCVSDE